MRSAFTLRFVGYVWISRAEPFNGRDAREMLLHNFPFAALKKDSKYAYFCNIQGGNIVCSADHICSI
jgi:hypothetical protein